MKKLLLNNIEICQKDFESIKQVEECLVDCLCLQRNEYYLIQNGKKLCNGDRLSDENIHCQLRLFGGKGGFGSMLRAIGAQIEKTTNREACRDLSGRRLRDINEEKRLKAWLEKQGEREREAEERKKRKVEKLLSVPKHEFKDERYEKTRATMTEKVNDAVEEGLKKVHEQDNDDMDKRPIKRKVNTTITKNKKSALWIGDDISSSDSTSEDEDSVPDKKQKVNINTTKNKSTLLNADDISSSDSTSKDDDSVPEKKEKVNTTTKNKSTLLNTDDISSSDSTSKDEDSVPEKKQKLST